MKPNKTIDDILAKYPNRVPVFVTRYDNSSTPNIDRHKYLVPIDLTMGQLKFIIRKRIKLHPEQALFMFIGSSLACTSDYVGSVFERDRSPDDGMLHVVYSCENTMG